MDVVVDGDLVSDSGFRMSIRVVVLAAWSFDAVGLGVEVIR